MLAQEEAPEKMENDNTFLNITGGTFMCAVSIACVPWVGWYLFEAGFKDLGKFLENKNECYLYDVAAYLYYSTPICLTLRAFVAPAMWKSVSEKKFVAFKDPAVLIWLALFLIPFGCNAIICLQKFGLSTAMGPQVVDDWPETCRMKSAAGYGLFITRALALFGAHICEALWAAWIVAFRGKPKGRVAGLMIPMCIMSLFMILGGPYNWWKQVKDPTSCDFMYVPWTYFSVTGVAIAVGVALLAIPSALPAAVTQKSAGGPYFHWSTIVFLIVAIAQLQVLRYTIQTAGEGYKKACGVNNVTYYFPRHWGLIFYDWGQLLSFNLWIVGNFLWANPPEGAYYAMQPVGT